MLNKYTRINVDLSNLSKIKDINNNKDINNKDMDNNKVMVNKVMVNKDMDNKVMDNKDTSKAIHHSKVIHLNKAIHHSKVTHLRVIHLSNKVTWTVKMSLDRYLREPSSF